MQHVSVDYYYDGQWKLGQRHGIGTCQFPTGENYKGEWQNDKMHGNGSVTYPSGDYFDGQWEEGKRVFGTLTSIDQSKKVEYRGAFTNGVPGRFDFLLFFTVQDL